MEDTQFFLIALKVGQYCIHGRRVLKETKPYYFCQGYEISEDCSHILVDKNKRVDDSVFNDYLQEKAGKGDHVPQVSIHAIVGKNGSGKSSLVELMLRLINNFAAILFGENITDADTAHLHYIDGIQGDLFYMHGENPYRLSIDGRSMRLQRYQEDYSQNESNKTLYCVANDKHLEEITENSDPILEDYGNDIRYYIKAFFYTIVSNYSIYAYNTLDYSKENVSASYEKKIVKKKFGDNTSKIKINESSRNWLNGLFHKNDGYKTPLVLTPFRDEGKININVENTLSRERFISLLLMSNDDDGKGFRIINGHLEVKGFGVKKKSDYGRAYINQNVDLTNITEEKYLELRVMIFSNWDEKLFGYESVRRLEDMAQKKKYGQTALNYVLYKTIKICTKYRMYEEFHEALEDYLSSKDEDKDLIFSNYLTEYIDNLIENRSHVTRKIRQAIAYLLIPEDLDVYEKIRGLIGVKELAKCAQNMVKYVGGYYKYDFYIREIEDMIPPAFLDVKIELKNTAAENSREKIAFETLSSGEKQQVYSISSMLYHLMNINSVEEDKSSNRYIYHYVNVVLEEIELYFHPEFQKRYISMILDGLAQIRLDSIYGVNICFITHSPFVLSDIPKGNLLVLEDGRSVCDKELKTFGANIYDMLKSSFFIEDSPIGNYAQWMITRIIIAMRVWRCIKDHPKVRGNELLLMISSPKIEKRNMSFLKQYTDDGRKNDSSFGSFKSHYSPDTLFRMICQIDEPVVHNALMTEWEELFAGEEWKAAEIARLKSRIAKLEEN